jgi:hypothetical protein
VMEWCWKLDGATTWLGPSSANHDLRGDEVMNR